MRTIALSLVAVLVLGGAAPARSAPDDHAGAIAALADMRAAIAEIVRIEDGYAVGHAAYLRAAHRAMNALVGRRDDGYAASFGDPGDGVGTLGHLDRMLDQTGSSQWTPAVQGAKANVLAAAANLQSALGQKQMEDYQADLTRALASLALVAGRSTEGGVLGGLNGALANTSLAVPVGASVVSGCAAPKSAPAYGVVAGKLAYVALPRSAAATAIPAGLGVSRVELLGDTVVLYAPLARAAAASCSKVSRLQRTRVVARTSVPAPYVAAQAHAGIKVYARACLQCHGADLQGTAGPGVAGTDFLKNAQQNKWTLSELRTTIFENMPFSNPGSLTPKEYADVTAFLLAANCYPAGSTPFPATASPALKTVKLGPIPGVKPTNAKLGTCTVR
ncbi:MAG: putative cytochrome c [Candidatus Eremiobacteraeota bacterium]|nr:putative cytochrome c [Candidatus Eremiobacteraeota bacterium]